MRRLAVIFASTALLLVTSGCKTACRQLTEKQCDCTQSNTEKTACLSRASAQETTFHSPPNEEAETVCGELLEKCDCRLIDTPAGKEACGLAVAGP